MSKTQTAIVEIQEHEGRELEAQLPRLAHYIIRGDGIPLSKHPGWLSVLSAGLRHRVYALEAVEEGQTRGLLLLAYVRSILFGRFLVSLPYVNYGGVMADHNEIGRRLIDRAVELADRLRVRYLELRHEAAVEHPRLTGRLTDKVHMRLPLPSSAEQLWARLSAKVRNQVRKGQKCDLTVACGQGDLLAEFYDVFSRNMRDLGTPVYGRRLFAAIFKKFPDRAEFCIVRQGNVPIAAALLLHGFGVTEVPSASSLREFNHTCANMLMYWHLLERAVQRGQTVFDFGRSSEESNTYRFKKQWGAEPHPAEWQYYLREGEMPSMRIDNPRYQRLIRIWQRLPVRLTRLIGPAIVRGIP